MRLASLAFGHSTAVRAGWLWTLYPYAIFFSAAYVGSHALSALELSLLTWLTVKLAQSSTQRLWRAYGLLWGIGVLTNPALLTLFPFFAAWLASRYPRKAKPWRELFLAAVLCAAVAAPWVARNYFAFGRWMPLRDNFWFEFWVGNTAALDQQIPLAHSMRHGP